MKKIILIMMAFITFNAFAMPISLVGKVLSKKIEQQIKIYHDVLNDESNYVEINEDKSEIYYLKRIRFEVSPYVSFDVPFFEGKVFPIIEFRWTRSNPKGYVNYRR